MASLLDNTNYITLGAEYWVHRESPNDEFEIYDTRHNWMRGRIIDIGDDDKTFFTVEVVTNQNEFHSIMAQTDTLSDRDSRFSGRERSAKFQKERSANRSVFLHERIEAEEKIRHRASSHDDIESGDLTLTGPLSPNNFSSRGKVVPIDSSLENGNRKSEVKRKNKPKEGVIARMKTKIVKRIEPEIKPRPSTTFTELKGMVKRAVQGYDEAGSEHKIEAHSEKLSLEKILIFAKTHLRLIEWKNMSKEVSQNF